MANELRKGPSGPVASPSLLSVVVGTTPFAPSAPLSGQELLVTVTVPAPALVVLPLDPNLNSRITVKDGLGQAGSGHPITIDGNGQMIDDLPVQIINSNLASLTLYWDGVVWRIV